MHSCTLEEDNGRRDASKTFAYLPNVSHAFREATQRRRGVCCEQLVCVSSYKRISVPILFLFGNMSGLDEDLCGALPDLKIHFQQKVNFGWFLFLPHMTSLVEYSALTAWLINNNWLISNLSFNICGEHLVMSASSLSRKSFGITTRVEDALVWGEEQGGHWCYISLHFKLTAS